LVNFFSNFFDFFGVFFSVDYMNRSEVFFFRIKKGRQRKRKEKKKMNKKKERHECYVAEPKGK
jgi:predicted membrane protein